MAVTWTPAKRADFKPGDPMRAESTSSHVPKIAFEGIFIGGENPRLELDLFSPVISWLEVKGYEFFKGEETTP